MHLAKGEPRVLEFVRIARRGRITHMCEFTLVALCAHVEQLGRYCGVKDKVAMEESAIVNKRR